MHHLEVSFDSEECWREFVILVESSHNENTLLSNMAGLALSDNNQATKSAACNIYLSA